MNESVSRIYPQLLEGKKPQVPTAAAAPLYDVLTKASPVCKQGWRLRIHGAQQ